MTWGGRESAEQIFSVYCSDFTNFDRDSADIMASSESCSNLHCDSDLD